MIDQKLHDDICRKLVDEGKVIEAGWVGFRYAVVPHGASPVQVDEMRKAFFAGAQHLFASIMSILEPGAEPTGKDLDRMTLIDKELKRYVAGVKGERLR